MMDGHPQLPRLQTNFKLSELAARRFAGRVEKSAALGDQLEGWRCAFVA
jgi:hypothetical protein